MNNYNTYYTFLGRLPARKYLVGVIDMALAQDPKPTTIAILSADDPFSVEVAAAAQKYAEDQGLQVVYFQKYPDKSTDLRAPLTEAKAKNPDIFLNSGHFARVWRSHSKRRNSTSRRSCTRLALGHPCPTSRRR
jgi:ABC-type branched-subunit amino acid transport system substrate-binding protein